LAKSVPCDDRATLGRKLPKEADAIVTPVDRGAALVRRQRADIAGALAEGLGNKAAPPSTSPQRDD
jgi:hypothetical protein